MGKTTVTFEETTDPTIGEKMDRIITLLEEGKRRDEMIAESTQTKLDQLLARETDIGTGVTTVLQKFADALTASDAKDKVIAAQDKQIQDLTAKEAVEEATIAQNTIDIAQFKADAADATAKVDAGLDTSLDAAQGVIDALKAATTPAVPAPAGNTGTDPNAPINPVPPVTGDGTVPAGDTPAGDGSIPVPETPAPDANAPTQ